MWLHSCTPLMTSARHSMAASRKSTKNPGLETKNDSNYNSTNVKTQLESCPYICNKLTHINMQKAIYIKHM